MQGGVSLDKTVIHIISEENEKLAFFWEDEKQKIYKVPDENIVERLDILNKYSIYKVLIESLKPRVRYRLNVVSRKKQKLVGRRFFYTMKRDSFKRFAFLPALSKDQTPGKIWGKMKSLDPDALILLGVGSKAQKKDEILQDFLQSRLSMPMGSEDILIPTYAVLSPKVGGKKKEGDLKGLVQQSFSLLYSQSIGDTVNQGPGASSFAQFDSFQMIFLDQFSFRRKRDSMGLAQRFWLKNQLKKKKATFLIAAETKKISSSLSRLIKKGKALTSLISASEERKVLEIPKSHFGYGSYEFFTGTGTSGYFMFLEVFKNSYKEANLGISFWNETGLVWKSPFKVRR